MKWVAAMLAMAIAAGSIALTMVIARRFDDRHRRHNHGG